MRILIVEPHATGHHASYLRWLVQAVVGQQWSVVIATTSAALAHPSLATIVADYAGVHTYITECVPGITEHTVRYFQLLRREIAYWRIFKRAVIEVRTKAPIDAVILPYVDYCFYALAILGSPFQELPWCGISMRLNVANSAANGKLAIPLKWRVAKRVLRAPSLKGLFVINPSVQQVPVRWCSAMLLSKVHYLRDPAEYQGTGERQVSRAAYGFSDGHVAILVFGSIDDRKGIDSLLSSLSSNESLENYMVILAGKQSANVQSLLRSAAYTKLLSMKRLIVINRFLSATEQDFVFSAVDVVWVGYRNHNYMSGVLVLAGKAGLPIIGTPEGEIGRLIAEHKLGVAANIDRPTEVYGALHAMLDARTRTEMGGNGHSAFASHTVANFGATVLAVFN